MRVAGAGFFFHGFLFTRAVNVSLYIKSNHRVVVNNELERMWREAVMADIEAECGNIYGWTKQTDEKFRILSDQVGLELCTT
jgi:hypothetical protein